MVRFNACVVQMRPAVAVQTAVSALELVAELHRIKHQVDCNLSETTQEHLATLIRHLLVFVDNMLPSDSSKRESSGQGSHRTTVVESIGQAESSSTELVETVGSTDNRCEAVDWTGMSDGMVENVCTCAYEACTELLHTCTDVYSTFVLQMSHLLEGKCVQSCCHI